MRVLVVLCFLVIGSSASAQEHITGSYIHIGKLTYGNFSDGTQSTTIRIGNMEYTDIWMPPKPISPRVEATVPEPNWAGIGKQLKTEPAKPNSFHPVKGLVGNQSSKNTLTEDRLNRLEARKKSR
jgi:hypothetical protein